MRSPSLAASSMSWVTKTIDFLSSCCSSRNWFCRRWRVTGSTAREGLVHEQHGRIGAEGPGHPHPLALAAGQLVGKPPGVALGIEADELEQLVDAAVDPGAVPTEQSGHHGHVVEDSSVGKEPALLDHVADAPAHERRGPW